MKNDFCETWDITPVPKPRMTRRDKFRQRDCVMRYWAFRDEVRLLKVVLPVSNAHVIFHMPMPVSWSKKKKREHLGQPHTQRPDLDNLIKGLGDACYQEDSIIWDLRASKIWWDTGQIVIFSGGDSIDRLKAREEFYK